MEKFTRRHNFVKNGEVRVLLVVPPAPKTPQWAPELAMGYLAGSLRSLNSSGINCKVEVLDCINANFSDGDFRIFLEERPPYDVVGFKNFSAYLSHAIKCIGHVKKRSPDSVTVAGGPHVSVMKPEYIMEDIPDLDYGIAGEGIRALPMLIRHLSTGEIDKREIYGLIWREEGRIRYNEPDFEVDIDLYGLPEWELIKPADYSSKEPYSFYTSGWPVAQIISSRGCPFECSFCSSFKVLGRKVRFRKIKNIITEMKMLVKDYGVKAIEFVDDNFLINRKFTRELCQRIIDEKIEVEWSCPQGLHLNSVDAETISLMERAGCRYLAVGIESGTDRILERIGKGLNREKIKKKLQIIKENSNIKIMGFFIIGFPTETEEEIESTISFATEIPLDLATFGVYCYMPGTRDTEDLIREHPEYENIIRNFFNLYAYPERMALKEASTLHHIPIKRLNYLKQKAHRRFFLRPSVVFKILKELNSPLRIRIFLRWLRMHFI